RLAVLIRLGFLELLTLLDAGIVIFPPGPGAAPSSRESNASVLLTLIAGPVVFPPAMLRSPLLSLPREVPVRPNGGTCESGKGVRAPPTPHVPGGDRGT